MKGLWYRMSRVQQKIALSLPPSAEGRITRLAAAHAQAVLDIDPLLEIAGLNSAEITRNTRISAKSQVKFLRLIAQELSDGIFGFHLAKHFDLREMGLFYYVQSSSATLGDALTHMARYTSCNNEGLVARYSLQRVMRIKIEYVGIPRHTDRQQMEFLVTTLFRICQELTGTVIRPIRLGLMHGRDIASTELDNFFGLPVEFGSERDEIVLPEAAHLLPVVSADPYLNECLVGYWEQTLERRSERQPPLRAAVENAILPLLPHGEARLDNIAKALHLSSRTLARRLEQHNITFTRVLDDMRSDLAYSYLEDHNLSIARIAWLLGFQEASTFTHAFKRWSGKTPSEYRKHQSPGQASE
jgi:AraC-like DNA-binding protein